MQQFETNKNSYHQAITVKHNIHFIAAPTLISFASMTILISLLLITIFKPATPLSFDYNGFNETFVKLEGNASIDANSDIQLTNTTELSVGRVTNLEQMHLWDMSSKSLADFTTEFSFNISAESQLYADGMTFFLAQPNLTVDIGLSTGLHLGIAVPPNYQNPFVAVEFDTKYNEGIDPNNNNGTHVGIDINSIISETTVEWFADILGKREYEARIVYNSSTYNLTVSFTGYNNGRHIQQYLSDQVDLREHLPEWVIIGFSAATGTNYELHTLKSWSFNSTLQIKQNSRPKHGSRIEQWVGLGIGLSFLFCFIGLAWFLIRRKRASSEEEGFSFDENMDDEFEKGTGPKKFSYNELVCATNNFAEAEKLGKGGFGDVYRGFLKELNSYVAIKRISRGSKQGTKEYATEIKVISQLRHKNLVQLIGWCHQKIDLLLIYEFMPNRSLDFHLFEERNFLIWKVRYSIAQDIASALLYLQESWEQCVLHRDIKSSNIMLDSNFSAKLGDFGLARLIDHNKRSQTTVVAGTIGYMANECLLTGKASKESDIFSFGVVALEIACGRKAIDPRAHEAQVRIVEWVWELYGIGKLLEAADPKLKGEFDIQQMERLMVVGLWCAHPDNMLRPSIRQAIHVLNFEAPLPVLPEKMPVPTYLSPGSRSLLSILLSIGATSFEIEDDGNQSSRNRAYTSSSQFSSSSAGSASSIILNIH